MILLDAFTMKNFKTSIDLGSRMITLKINGAEVELQVGHDHFKNFQILEQTDSEDFTSATSDIASIVEKLAGYQNRKTLQIFEKTFRV